MLARPTASITSSTASREASINSIIGSSNWPSFASHSPISCLWRMPTGVAEADSHDHAAVFDRR
jgi:hypothetical protein